jgi:hypothetical protein
MVCLLKSNTIQMNQLLMGIRNISSWSLDVIYYTDNYPWEADLISYHLVFMTFNIVLYYIDF